MSKSQIKLPQVPTNTFVESKDTECSDAYNFDASSLRFGEVKRKEITGDNGTKINWMTIPIGACYNADQKSGPEVVGDLLFKLDEELQTFGVAPDLSGKKLQMATCLFSQGNKTDKQVAFVETINKITAKVISFLVSIKYDIGVPDLIESDLRKMNPIYYTKNKDTKIPDPDKPMLYIKINQHTVLKDGKKKVDLKEMSLTKKFFKVRPVIQFDSISISGGKYKISVTLNSGKMKSSEGAKKIFISDDEEDEDGDGDSSAGSAGSN